MFALGFGLGVDVVEVVGGGGFGVDDDDSTLGETDFDVGALGRFSVGLGGLADVVAVLFEAAEFKDSFELILADVTGGLGIVEAAAELGGFLGEFEVGFEEGFDLGVEGLVGAFALGFDVAGELLEFGEPFSDGIEGDLDLFTFGVECLLGLLFEELEELVGALVQLAGALAEGFVAEVLEGFLEAFFGGFEEFDLLSEILFLFDGAGFELDEVVGFGDEFVAGGLEFVREGFGAVGGDGESSVGRAELVGLGAEGVAFGGEGGFFLGEAVGIGGGGGEFGAEDGVDGEAGDEEAQDEGDQSDQEGLCFHGVY